MPNVSLRLRTLLLLPALASCLGATWAGTAGAEEIIKSSLFRFDLESSAVFKYDAAPRDLHPSTKALARIEDLDEVDYYSRVVFIDDSRVMTISWSGYVTAWDADTGKLAWKAQPNGRVPLLDLALSADRQFALVVGDGDVIALVRLKDGFIERSWHGDQPARRTAVAISADGTLFATGDVAGVVEVWSFAEAKPQATWNTNADFGSPSAPPIPHWPATHLAFTPDGHFLYAADPTAVRLWNIGTGELIRTLGDTGSHGRADPEHWWFSSLDFSPDQSYVIAGVYDGARVIDLTNGETLRTLGGHPMGVISTKLDVKRSEIVTVARDFTFRFFDAETAELKRSAWLPCPQFPFIYVLADAVFNEKGDRIAMASSDPIWDRMGYYPVLRTYAYTP